MSNADTNLQEWNLDASAPVLEDDPDEASVKRVLMCLMPCKKYELARADEDGRHNIYWTLEWRDRVFDPERTKNVKTFQVLVTAEQNGSEPLPCIEDALASDGIKWLKISALPDRVYTFRSAL